jgi:hypothetical protein
MLQLLILAILFWAAWKLRHDFLDDRIFTDPAALSNGHVKQAAATARVVRKFGAPGPAYWPRFAERVDAYAAEQRRRDLAIKP